MGGILTYFLQENHYEARFPIDYVPYSGQPRTEVVIEGVPYSLVIDLGSPFWLSLKNEILEKIEKQPTGNVISIDIKGHQYTSQAYIIPQIKIRNLSIMKVHVTEEGPGFLSKGSLVYDNTEGLPNPKLGRIGRGLFLAARANLFLDFHNSVMFACCHLKDRKKDGYRPEIFTPAPFYLSREEGIILEFDTDFGRRRFMLDTGSTKSVIKPSLVKNFPQEIRFGAITCHSTKFILGGKDFGDIDFFLFEMDSLFDGIDGIIGMDFLKEHAVYLDFEKKIAHIAKSTECF